MNDRVKKAAIPIFRWTLGLVVLWQSLRFTFGPAAAHFFAKTGMPTWIRPAIGGAEILAALLYLLPFTEIGGSYALLTIFSLAAVIHILHGDYDVSVLILYGVGVFATLANRNERSGPPIAR
ncbi:MAG: DoxX family protein [Candidatus Acidiferrales bacterium]|jgi:cbb3-type cytochrome oxidase subunit 1